MALYKRELIINVTFLILANLLIKPYYIFFVERNIQNQVGTAVWGAYFTLFSLSMLPQIILDLGLTSYINQRLSGHRDQVLTIWRDTMWVKPILALLFFGLFVFICFVGGYFSAYGHWILWIATNQVLLSIILFVRAYISGLGHYRIDSFFSIGDKLLFIIIFSILAYSGRVIDIETFLWIQTLSLLAPLMLGLGWLLWKTGLVVSQIDRSKTWQILKASTPFAGIFVLMVLFCRMEPVWIDWLRPDGPYQAGVYAAGYRLLDAANMMGFLFAGILLPMFSHAISLGDRSEYQSVFDLAWSLMISLSVLVSFPILFHHKYIMALLYTDDHPGILNILILCLVPLTINYLLSTILTAANKVIHMNYLFLISIGVSVITHLLLTPGLGARGAAISLLITQVVTSILLALLIQKESLVHFSRRYHLMILAKAVLFAAISGWLISLLNLASAISLLSQVALLILVFGLTGVMPWRELYRLLLKK